MKKLNKKSAVNYLALAFCLVMTFSEISNFVDQIKTHVSVWPMAWYFFNAAFWPIASLILVGILFCKRNISEKVVYLMIRLSLVLIFLQVGYNTYTSIFVNDASIMKRITAPLGLIGWGIILFHSFTDKMEPWIRILAHSNAIGNKK